MGAIERNGYRFVPEFSVLHQNGAIHVYHQNHFIEEIHFQFNDRFPELDKLEEIVDEYCQKHNI